MPIPFAKSVRPDRAAEHPRRPAMSRAVASRAVALGILLAAAGVPAFAADLEVEISGLTPVQAAAPAGQVMVAAFSSASSWLKQPVATGKAALADARGGVVTVRLTGLPAGPVAITVFQDMNGNGKLDSNMIGMPIEPFAFSRQAQGNFGPPSFEQAVLEAGVTRHAIRLPAP
ncbi:hypothetical protein CDN99_00135 [Roseateles aquatilis]|uniref:DUF2141 domain-containing protein n=1 Tax=Roseateles aquatilis TaxID=431061 RepID=A0A246JL80_9BURK|nr:DUF2141 domain-containing protein [Roseateles aquatilis]OWQ92959.1 hypothetical protein CDN99_00135 [Roseateles aquatilis]